MQQIKDASAAGGLDPYQAAMHGISPLNPTDAGRKNRQALERLYPYLVEAYLRDMQDVRLKLVEVIGRSVGIGAVPQLPRSTSDYFAGDVVDPFEDESDEEDDGSVPF